MATPAYVGIDPNAPSGPTQAPDAYSASDLANVRALRDAVIHGTVIGCTYSQAGGTAARPLNRQWTIGALFFLLQCSYAGSGLQLPTTATWYWSNDSGASYSTISSSNLTWDAAANLTNATAHAGSWCSWLAAYHKGLYAAEAIGGHAGGVGGAVHGLGTMSTQNANAVAITGGSIANVNIGNSNLNQFGRAYPIAPASLANGAAWDWATNSGNQQNTQFGFNHPQILNPQPGEVKRLFVIGPGAITIGDGAVNFQWAVGHPVWSSGDGTLINCVALNSAWVIGTTIPL